MIPSTTIFILGAICSVQVIAFLILGLSEWYSTARKASSPVAGKVIPLQQPEFKEGQFRAAS